MNTIYLRLFVLGLAFILAACDNRPPTSAKKSEDVMSVMGSVMEAPQALKLNVNEAVIKGLKTSSNEPISLSSSMKLEIKPVTDEPRFSVNGKLLLLETWQADYLDNIDGGKLELQLRFDD